MLQSTLRGTIIKSLLELGRPATAREIGAACFYSGQLTGTRSSIFKSVSDELELMSDESILKIDSYGFGANGRINYLAISDILTAMSVATDID